MTSDRKRIQQLEMHLIGEQVVLAAAVIQLQDTHPDLALLLHEECNLGRELLGLKPRELSE